MSPSSGSGATSPDTPGAPSPDTRAAVAAVRRWYHCIELAPGVVSPGMFDLRSTVDRLPWPDVRGKRCLDVGTADGFFAFELERRGAAEVLATDIGGHESWDWEPHNREAGLRFMRSTFGAEMGAGFPVARDARGSAVAFERVNVHELSPERLGTFDVVVCGSLLLHLRDPLGALEAIRSVCRGHFLSANQIDLGRSLLYRHRPLFRLDGTSGATQWWIPNAAGHRQLLLASGFSIERESGLYSIAYGPAHDPPPGRPKAIVRQLARRALTGNDGVPHHAVLAVPAVLAGAAQSTGER